MLRDVRTSPGTGEPRPITVRVAARRTGYHPSTIRRALQSGALEGYRAGARGRYRIPAAALERWIRPAGPNQESR